MVSSVKWKLHIRCQKMLQGSLSLPNSAFVGAHMPAGCLGMQWRASPDYLQRLELLRWADGGASCRLSWWKASKAKRLYWLAWITDREPFEKPHWIPPDFPTSQSDVTLLQILYQLVRGTQMPQLCCSLPSSTPDIWVEGKESTSQACTDSLRNAPSHCDSSVIQLEKQFWDHSRFPSRLLSRPRSAGGD